MRITGGTARGRKLQGPKANYKTAIRPTSDRVREAVGNMLAERFQSAYVLDLFAGTGSFGLEALSRGAKKVVFVDRAYEALALIRRNLEKCFVNPAAAMFKVDLNKNHVVENFFRRLKTVYRFDLIYLDPPYKKKLAAQTMIMLAKSDILAANSIIIVEEHWHDSMPEQTGKLHLSMKKKYGETGIWIYGTKQKIRKAKTCADRQ